MYISIGHVPLFAFNHQRVANFVYNPVGPGMFGCWFQPSYGQHVHEDIQKFIAHPHWL